MSFLPCVWSESGRNEREGEEEGEREYQCWKDLIGEMGSNVFVVVFDFFGKFEVFLASAEKKKST